MMLVMRLGAERALVLAQIIYVDVAIGLYSVFISFDSQRPDEAQAAFGIGEDAHNAGYEPDELPGCSTPRHLDLIDIFAHFIPA